MTDILADLVRSAERHAHKCLIERREPSLMGLYHLVAPEGGGQDAVLPCAWRNEIEKQIFLFTVKAAARQIGAVAAVCVHEAWMTRIPVGPTPWHAKRARENLTPPSQDPQRREVVMIAATDGKRTLSKMLQIVRDKPGGRIVALVEDDLPHASLEGRMIEGIIPERRTHDT
jgi:hypothetical protein